MMQKISQLKKQIEQCTDELEQNYADYDKNKQNFIKNINVFSHYFPAISAVTVLGTLILTFSSRARGKVGKLSQKILLVIVNVRLLINTVTMVANFFQHVSRFIASSRAQQPQ